MRPFEWLLLLSFLPALVLPFVPHRWRRRWLITSALLPGFVCIVHLITEGWRIQMLPVYVLAALVLMSRLPMLRVRKDTLRRGRGALVTVLTTMYLMGSFVLAGWALPVVTLPEPTGPYAVGIVDRELVDPNRDRRLMVSVWYPAEHVGTPAPLTHHPDEVAKALANLSGLPEQVYQHLRYSRLAASEDVPLAEEDTPFPVLVFSHGMVGLRLQNSSTLQDLASWGYVVVAIDHTDSAAVTVFPDGEARYYNLEQFGVPQNPEPTKALMNQFVVPVWVADQQFVYDTLETWTATDPLLAGKLDLTRIASFGHSFGGAVALEVCRIDPRCKAAVNLDGGLYGDILTMPTVRPLMLMTSAESTQFGDAVEEWQQMINNADAPAYWLELPNSTHFSFTITQLLSPILIPSNFEPRSGLQTVDRYLRAFFDTTLRGEESLILEEASRSTDVRWITQ